MSFVPGNTGVASTFPDGFALADGTVTAPTFRFSDTQTGFYKAGTNSWGFASNGVQTALVSSTGAWTFGSAAGSALTHTVQSAGATLLNVKSASGSITRIALSDGVNNDVYIRRDGGASSSLSFLSDATVLATATSAGVWTFGPDVNYSTSTALKINGGEIAFRYPTSSTPAHRIYVDNSALVSGSIPMAFKSSYTSSGGNANFVFVNNANVVVGRNNENGEWTIGPSTTSSLTHTIQNGTLIVRHLGTSGSDASQIRLITSNIASGGTFIGYDNQTSGAIWAHGADVQNGPFKICRNVSGNVATNVYGQVDLSGAWTLGPTSGGVIHTIQSPGNGAGSAVLHIRKQSISINTNGNTYLECYGASGGFDGYLGISGTTFQAIDSSDSRKKENVRPANYGLTQILALNPVLFDWKEEYGGETDIKGFLAQEVKTVLPECVTVRDEIDLGGFEDAHYLGTANMIPVLVKAIQEIKSQLDAAVSRIAELEGAQ
jgi:hypothetical protein